MGFPQCCGADILADFPEGYYYYDKHEEQKQITQMQNSICRAINDVVGIVLAITNRHQLRTSKLLKKFGFKVLRQFRNPNSGYRLKLWELNLNNVSTDRIAFIADKLIRQTNRQKKSNLY